MNCQNVLPKHRINNPMSFPRVRSTSNLSSLTDDLRLASHKTKSRRSISVASSGQSECNGSENSQVLYMAGSAKRSKRLNHSSLSSIENRPSRIADDSSDAKAEMEEESAAEEISWNVIDREIFEWQYVCHTGRPYWWSPESKDSRLKKLQPRLFNEPAPRLCFRPVDDRPNPEYNSMKRRAISDGFVADPDGADDLVQLIAIQLLGSCFTLRPDHTGSTSPEYSSPDKHGYPNTPDSRMISSLRMHTNFRHSPCFGHQARNTSPAQLWHGAYDGPFPGSSPPATGTGFHTPVIRTCDSLSRRCRERGELNVTEGSTDCCSVDSNPEDWTKYSAEYNLDPTESATARHERNGTEDDNPRASTAPLLPAQSNGTRQRQKKDHFPRHENDIDTQECYHEVEKCSSDRTPKTYYRLQPVIRSEPHHVFVQPVKELVVKRWRTFRRRFGGSLHSPLPVSTSEDFMSPTSTSAPSGASSPGMSSDGKTRRRRAQERGDIHSASVDSTTHYNSPVSGNFSPNVSGLPSPCWADSAKPSPIFQLADPLAAAAALALAEIREDPVQARSLISPVPSSRADSLASPPVPTPAQLQPNPTGIASSQLVNDAASRVQPKINSSTPSFSSRRSQKRQHRKSMLSEVCTPEDFADHHPNTEHDKEIAERSSLGPPGGALASPRGQSEPVADPETRPSILNPVPVREFSLRRMTMSSTQPRLGLSRTSTSGMQIFTPDEEGVELDGMPTGPSKRLWDGPGKRRERTFL